SAMRESGAATHLVVVVSYSATVWPVGLVPSSPALVRTTIAAFTGPPLAPSVGVALTTLGDVTAALPLVVKWLVKAGTTLPALSCTPLTISVIGVLGGSTPCGVICTVWFPLLKLMASGAAVSPPPLSWIVARVTVSGSIGALKPTRTCAFTGTFVSPSAGLTTVTVGAVVTTLVPVVKQAATYPDTGCPALPRSPLLK